MASRNASGSQVAPKPGGLGTNDSSCGSQDGSHNRSPTNFGDRRIRPNVTIRPKMTKPSQDEKTKFTLADMLKNAKKVTNTFVKPVVEQALGDHLPNPFLDEIVEGLDAKFTSFQRAKEYQFTKEFGRSYSEFRQKAWKKALAKEKKASERLPSKGLSGICFAPREEWLLRDVPRETYICKDNLKVILPPGVLNLFNYNQYESSRIYSGLDPGNVSQHTDRLRYKNTYDLDNHLMYIDELAELKAIYKSFWYLTTTCQDNWLSAFYRKNDSKIISYDTTKFTPDGLFRDDNQVMFVVEHHLIITSVDKLYERICNYRTLGKEYDIGDCDSHEAVLFSLLLTEVHGIDETLVKRYVTKDAVDEMLLNLSMEFEFFVPPEEKEDSDDEEARLLSMFSGLGEGLEQATSNPTQEYEVYMHPVSMNLGNIDLSQLDTGEVDSFVSDSDYQDEEDDREEAFELPYEKGLHNREDEFESHLLDIDTTDVREDYIRDDESVTSDNMPDNELTPLEELGVDLVDPAQRTGPIPTFRRVAMIWDPGGGRRSVLQRGSRLLRRNGRTS
jgi:hypothetical protein